MSVQVLVTHTKDPSFLGATEEEDSFHRDQEGRQEVGDHHEDLDPWEAVHMVDRTGHIPSFHLDMVVHRNQVAHPWEHRTSCTHLLM